MGRMRRWVVGCEFCFDINHGHVPASVIIIFEPHTVETHDVDVLIVCAWKGCLEKWC